MKQPDRFILVDDDSGNNMICDFVIKGLQKEADVVSFEVPELGLAYIEKQYEAEDKRLSTVLLLDINMPSISGWQFLERFAKFDDGVKNAITIYILSSSVDPHDLERAEKNPYVRGYLTKPLSPKSIQQVVNELNFSVQNNLKEIQNK